MSWGTCRRTHAAATSSTTSSAAAISCAPPSSPPTWRSSTGAPSSRERPASRHWSIASPSRATPSTSTPTRGGRGRSDGAITRKPEGHNHAALHGRLHTGIDTVQTGYERGHPLVRFRVERVLRGISTSREIKMMGDWFSVPAPNTPVLAWILRGCTIDGWACGDYLRLTPQRNMFWYLVDSDWRRDSTLLSCDSLENDVIATPDSSGLEAFEEVVAIGLARLKPNDPVNSWRNGYVSGAPGNGGTWPVEDLQWTVGAVERTPRFVRF